MEDIEKEGKPPIQKTEYILFRSDEQYKKYKDTLLNELTENLRQSNRRRMGDLEHRSKVSSHLLDQEISNLKEEYDIPYRLYEKRIDNHLSALKNLEYKEYEIIETLKEDNEGQPKSIQERIKDKEIEVIEAIKKVAKSKKEISS